MKANGVDKGLLDVQEDVIAVNVELTTKSDLLDGALDPTQIPSEIKIKSGEGVNYIVVDVSSGDPAVNGSNLRLSYNAAKLLTPNGSVIAEGNTATVFLPPATYDLGTTGLVLDKSWVHLEGVSTEKTAFITAAIQTDYAGTLMPTVANVNLTNLDVFLTWSQDIDSTDNTVPTAYAPNTNLYSHITNCNFGQTVFISWRNGIEYPGVYRDLTGLSILGMNGGEMSGEAYNCRVDIEGLGSLPGVMSGYMKECYSLGPAGLFGGEGLFIGTITGTMEECSVDLLIPQANTFGNLDGGTLLRCTSYTYTSYPVEMTNGARMIDCVCLGDPTPGTPTRDGTSKMINCSWGDVVITD